MDFIKNKNNKKNGFTLIEALVVLFIFSLISITFYYVLTAGTKYIVNSKNRLGALALADEKMEIVRNMKYDDIGTVDGEVSGNILQNETVMENAKQYNVHTLVEYVDDPFDKLGYEDTVWFEDFKRVSVTVSWGSATDGGEVKLISRFVPPGLEVPSPDDGILAINIFSDQPGGAGISGASVRVVNSETGLDTTKQTDSSGNVTLIGDKIKDSIQKYEITVTKSGYETVNTLPPYPTTEYNPIDTHASVITGSINVTNIVQNELADLKIATVDYLNHPIPNINFHLTGGRILGVEAELPNDPIYNIDIDASTNSNGEKDFSGISPGQFTFSLLSTETNYELIGTDPPSPFSLFSATPLTFKAKLASKTATSLLVKIKRSDDNSPIAGAQVKLSNASGYDVTQTSSAEGAAFFPETSDIFQSGNYDLKITADGFPENNSQVTINTNELKTETILLTE